MRLRISFRKTRKLTIFITATIICLMALFVLGELFLFKIDPLRRQILGQQGIFKTISILASKSEDELKEYVRKNYGDMFASSEKLSGYSPQELKGVLRGALDTNTLPIILIKRKIMIAGLIAVFALVFGGVVLVILAVLKKVLVKERRSYERYDVDAKVYFRVAYDIKTRVEFQVVDEKKEGKSLSEKYSAITKNISAEGMCFTCDKKLEKSDNLYIELYLPNSKEPIHMEGEVRWSHSTSLEKIKENKFDTGVRLLTVNGKRVHESIHYDKANRIVWSIVLESVFGSFSNLIKKNQETD